MAKLSPRIASFPRGTDRASKKQMLGTRDQQIRELTAAELDEVLASGELLQNEYVGEVNKRYYWAAMNQKDLLFQATFDPWAEAELRRRNGELGR